MNKTTRFWSKVATVGNVCECWEWTGALQSDGYGSFNLGNGQTLAHRISYQSVNGPMPAGLELDHLCRNRACVNPWHLEAITHRENILRGVGCIAVNASKVACANGHEYAAGNLLLDNGVRRCRVCTAEKYRRYKAKRKAALSCQ